MDENSGVRFIIFRCEGWVGGRGWIEGRVEGDGRFEMGQCGGRKEGKGVLLSRLHLVTIVQQSPSHPQPRAAAGAEGTVATEEKEACTIIFRSTLENF